MSRFITDLRKSLGPFGDRVESVAGGYRLRVEPNEVDIDRVVTTVAAANACLVGPTVAADASADELAVVTAQLRELITKIGLAGNPRLSELQHHEAVERSHNELRVSMIEAFATALHQQRQHTEIVVLIERIIDEHPYHERFWHLLMQSLMATGRNREAAQAGRRLENLLAEMGVVASEPVREMQAELQDRFAQEIAQDSDTAPAQPVAIPTWGPPSDRAALIGRVDDLRAVRQLLESERMVTIIGLGGSGKTRLSLGLVEALGQTMPVYHLDLRTVTDASAVLPLAASALGVSSAVSADAPGLANAVARQRFALLIDNCEHLLEPCAELVTALHGDVPGAHLLATSRVALGASGEATYSLAPLPVEGSPDRPAHIDGAIGQTPSFAAQLFLARSQRWIAPKPTARQLDIVERVCSRLNGLPLAIEIAAAQLAIMSLDQLDARTTATFAADATTLEPAVAAANDVLDWTWTNLSPSQQALLTRLSVFASGWTEDSARAVRAGPGSITADLQQLIALSLVVHDPRSGRQTMLVPVREYAAARLEERGETAVMRDRLAAWALELTAQWTFPQHHLWSGPNDVLRPEHGNLLAALAHLEASDRLDELVTLAVASSGMMVNRGLAGELTRWLKPHMLGRHSEARASIGGWRSRSDTDHWHYMLEIVRAIVNGATGDPHQATAELGASVRALPEAGAWGRAGIIQTAYAMLADYRSEPELADDLFASAVTSNIMLLAVVIAHAMDRRGLTGDAAWAEVGIEFWTRIVPPDSVAATATSTPQLLRWWTSGQIDDPALAS